MQTSVTSSGRISQWALVAVALVLIIAGSYFFMNKTEPTVINEPAAPPPSLKSSSATPVVTQKAPIMVIAMNGKLTPNTFDMTVLEPVILSIQAKDRDYTFAVKDSGIKYFIKKGSGTEFSIGSLGVGDHTYTCGTGCSGVVHVHNEDD